MQHVFATQKENILNYQPKENEKKKKKCNELNKYCRSVICMGKRAKLKVGSTYTIQTHTHTHTLNIYMEYVVYY